MDNECTTLCSVLINSDSVDAVISRSPQTLIPNDQIPSSFLPPVNEVWGKVMFLHLFVSHSVHGGGLCMMSLPVWLPGPMFLLGGLCPWSHVPSRGGGLHPEGRGFAWGRWGLHPGERGVCIRGRRVCIQGGKGACIQGDSWADPPPSGTRKVGGTHPTGMLSCCFVRFRLKSLIVLIFDI